MSDPLLTVVIANYNHAAPLPKALDSLVSQNFSPFEILIVDDASTDGSSAVIDDYMKKYPFIRCIWHEKNQGVCFSANEGIREAHGRYVHSMGADDFRLEHFLSTTMQTLLDNPAIGIACSDFGYVRGNTNDGPVQTDKLIENVMRPAVFDKRHIIKVFQRTNFWLPGHTAIFKKELVIKYQGYDPSLKFLSDWFLLHRIALCDGAIYIPETLSVWWIRSDSYSSNLIENKKSQKAVYREALALTLQREHYRLFAQSTLLRVICNPLFTELWYRPKYWPLLFYFGRKTLYWRFQQVKKRLMESSLPTLAHD